MELIKMDVISKNNVNTTRLKRKIIRSINIKNYLPNSVLDIEVGSDSGKKHLQHIPLNKRLIGYRI